VGFHPPPDRYIPVYALFVAFTVRSIHSCCQIARCNIISTSASLSRCRYSVSLELNDSATGTFRLLASSLIRRCAALSAIDPFSTRFRLECLDDRVGDHRRSLRSIGSDGFTTERRQREKESGNASEGHSRHEFIMSLLSRGFRR